VPPPVGRGQWGLLLSVRPSVAYIANNWRTRRPSVPKFGARVPHLWCDSLTSFKVTRPINFDTHRAPYLPNGKASELQTWYTDGGRPASATGAMTSKVKGQGRKVTWSVLAVLSQCCTCVISGRRGHTVSAEPGGHTSCYICGFCLILETRTSCPSWLKMLVTLLSYIPPQGLLYYAERDLLALAKFLVLIVAFLLVTLNVC